MLIVMHISSGCIMKSVQVDGCNHWVDSLCYNNDRMLMQLTRATRPSRDLIQDNVKTTMHLIPFFAFDEPPRPTLTSSMSHQAICRPRVGLTSTLASTTNFLPVVRTPMMQNLIDSMTDTRFISLPGVSLLVAFVNAKENYEDSLIASKSVNDMHLFKHVGIIHHPVKDGTDKMEPGYVIGEKDKWFRPHSKATVIREGVSSKMSRYVTASMEDNQVHEGNKFATWHGQKFTVGEIRDHNDMPTFICTRTGKPFIPHMIIASSSVHNRGTLGQIYEAWAGMKCVDDLNYDPRHCDKYVIKDPFIVSEIPKTEYTCFIQDGFNRLCNDDGDPIIADYGICHLWQLSHIARDKQHYMSDMPTGVGVKRGKLNRSGVRFGEAECMSGTSNALVNCISYLSDNGDLGIVKICSKCRRLVINCDCREWNPSTDVAVRNAFVKMDVMRTAYSVNGVRGTKETDEDDHEITIEGKCSAVPFIAGSFVYNA